MLVCITHFAHRICNWSTVLWAWSCVLHDSHRAIVFAHNLLRLKLCKLYDSTEGFKLMKFDLNTKNQWALNKFVARIPLVALIACDFIIRMAFATCYRQIMCNIYCHKCFCCGRVDRLFDNRIDSVEDEKKNGNGLQRVSHTIDNGYA